MSKLKKLKPNVPRANLEDYVVTLYGRGKAGKSSLFFNAIKKHFGRADAGLLGAFENGYSALNGVYAADFTSWEDFIETVDELVADRDELPYKVFAMDTVDIAYKMVCDYVIKRERIKDKKQYRDITDIPWGGGYALAAEAFYTQIDRLRKAGYGIWYITHDKDKKFTSRDGVEYDQTTLNLPARARDIIVNMSDFLIFVDNAKKLDDEGKVVDERLIYFRAEGSDLEAGSRFKNVPHKIAYDVDLFLQTFEKAVLSEVGADVDLAALKAEQAAEREEAAAAYVAEETAAIGAKAIIAQIDEKAKLLTDADKKAVVVELKDILGGTANYKNTEDVELLQQCLDAVSKYVG